MKFVALRMSEFSVNFSILAPRPILVVAILLRLVIKQEHWIYNIIEARGIDMLIEYIAVLLWKKCKFSLLVVL